MPEPPPIASLEQEVVEEFQYLDDWTDRYAYLIDLGRGLPPLDPSDKTEAHRVHGCQSQVWLTTSLHDGRVHFEADSDAMITKGLIALLIRVLSDQPAEDIARARLTFLERIGLHRHLSPTRSNGLHAMLRRMKTEALSYIEPT